ncbi:FAD:protein FMN transferase [Erwinia tracheiphila]|uniref:FAD:protein FMN transferase n=1 Tax=Erwinia tracheiphila TaxID=65700 RepID=A0A345CVQ3_9GAMM|nr:FAD:protein FMN transferase [Erwinia tracheiphila]AXF77520.1 FAD:protein FMN transferase [Erwinia tracheiphila]UIA83786.1 FAD:protein FMN transferase [Erwinia tracheiphila]UIA92369.1 FAD:protein FMN transferase [Erwinia tracheiphila]
MSSEHHIYSYSAVLMGSPILLKLFRHDEALAAHAFRLIKKYEDLLTVNRARSEVMDINLAAGHHAVRVSDPVFALIKCALAASLLKDSSFNLTIGPLVKRWRIGFQGDRVPPPAEIAALLQRTRPQQVILDDAARTVFLAESGMEIDLGAIAKGFIADRVRDYLQSQGIAQGLINLGGNVQTLGAPPDGWSVGLKKPFAADDALVGVITVRDKSVVTSGVYERYFEQHGRRYHHILDPQTGYPLDNELDSVTIISTDSLDGDIWSTLIFGMGVKKGCTHLRLQPGIEAILVTKQREVILSSSSQFSFTLVDNHYQVMTGSTV